ncbi:cyanophycinase [Fulvivirgaceae bacterium PWU5]|uniref:Cyanophycinase n=1 Tax=Dawidia cretensis TaxID=2782350 RepID=A0AAP2DWD0_9BACT|nr:cyanophycinase [Dawidia cretensis]MBT1707589.1 cyanophycinase [Dawidia cretensis]
MKRYNTTLFILVVTAGYAWAQSGRAGKLFIIGGGARPDALVERMITETGLRQGGYAVVLPMSSAEPDSAVYYVKTQLVKLGVSQVYGLNFVKGETPGAARLDSVRGAKLIYISGGDQNRFMDVVRGTEIEKAILEARSHGAMVSGTSAGAAVMSRVMITGNELKHPDYASTFKNIEAENIETKPGLGLMQQAIVDQHFVRRSRYNRLISAVIEFPSLTGIGIDEATAILVDGDKIEVVGESQVIVLENPKKSKSVRNGKLGAKDLRLTILLPGDAYRLK